jgi:four helix bundle protein
MGVRRFEDLIAWQLADKLKEEVFALCETPRVASDRKFCDQIKESARSAPSNIAEGFGRYYPKENVRFLRIAAGSIQETRNHLIDGYKRRYFQKSELDRLTRLALRAFKATTRFIAYLLHAQAPDPFSLPEFPLSDEPENLEP